MILHRIFQLIWLAMLSSMLIGLAAAAENKPTGEIRVDETSFRCMTKMTPVRGFYVDNLQGNRNATLAVAKSATGGIYPPGSVVQLVPTEVMVKQRKGFNAATKDWEFFELDVSTEGTKIRKRGASEVVNRFGGNCFDCHVKARPEWDLVCEDNHGCDRIPLTDAMIRALQRTDPRCKPSSTSPEDAAALKQLSAILNAPRTK